MLKQNGVKMKNEIFAVIAELETMQSKIAEIMENVTDENAEQLDELDDAIMQIDNAIARLHEAV